MSNVSLDERERDEQGDATNAGEQDLRLREAGVGTGNERSDHAGETKRRERRSK